MPTGRLRRDDRLAQRPTPMTFAASDTAGHTDSDCNPDGDAVDGLASNIVPAPSTGRVAEAGFVFPENLVVADLVDPHGNMPCPETG